MSPIGRVKVVVRDSKGNELDEFNAHLSSRAKSSSAATLRASANFVHQVIEVDFPENWDTVEVHYVREKQ